MDNLVSNADLKDRVLRTIGRNLISFQRLETILKSLSELRPFAGNLPEMETQLKERRQRTERSTLGTVIPLWLETAYGHEPRGVGPTTDLDVRISAWLQLGIPEQVLDEHAQKLDHLLTERNWFVHTALVEIDLDSNEQCENLLARLDEQEKQVAKQIEFLRPIVKLIFECVQVFVRDDVQECIRREMSRPNL